MVRHDYYTPAQHAFIERRSIENQVFFYRDELTRIARGEQVLLTPDAGIRLRKHGLLTLAHGTRRLTEKARVLLKELEGKSE